MQSGTSSCAGNPITVQAYGTGNAPIFYADDVFAGTWTNVAGTEIWYTDMGNTNPKGWATESDTVPLHRWSARNDTLIRGTYCPTSSTTAGTAGNTTGPYVFVRLSDGSDPNSATMRVSNFAVGDTNRGLWKGATGANRGTYGQYIDIKDVKIVGSPSQGISPNGPGWRTIGVEIQNTRKDGLIAMMYATGNESADGMTDYYGYYHDNVLGGGGGCCGQGVTVYAPNVSLVGTFAYGNGMAGIDVLDYGTDVEPDNFVCLRCVAYHNARSPMSNSFDPNMYIDGADHWLFWGSHMWDVGISGSSGQVASRQGFKLGSEHPTTEIATDGYLINTFITGSHSFGIKARNLNQGEPSNIENIFIQYATIFVNAGTSGDRAINWLNFLDQEGELSFKNNIVVGNSGTVLDDSYSAGQFLDSDYNMYYRRTQTSASTNLFTVSSTNYDLAGWRTLSGEDANSTYDDPEITTDSATAPNVYLQGTSPAINAGSQADSCNIEDLTWVPSTIRTDIGTNCVRGEAVAGTEDVMTSPDLGFHFSAAQLTSTNVTPPDFSTGTVGTQTITFTMPDKVTALLYNWKIQVELPAGFALNSGSSTALGNISGFDGGATLAISGQKATITRDGDGTSTFPGTISFTLSNIKNPTSAGSGGTYKIKLIDPRTHTQSVEACNGIYESGTGCIQAQDTAVGADTFTTSQATPPRFQCSGTRINFSGKILL